MSKEVWRRVSGFQNYDVSTMGRVLRRGKFLSGCAGTGGYATVTLRSRGRRKTAYLHRLVLEAFVGKCPDGHECNHKNGDKLDNRLENLEWVTPKENTNHAIRIGLWDGRMNRDKKTHFSVDNRSTQ